MTARGVIDFGVARALLSRFHVARCSRLSRLLSLLRPSFPEPSKKKKNRSLSLLFFFGSGGTVRALENGLQNLDKQKLATISLLFLFSVRASPSLAGCRPLSHSRAERQTLSAGEKGASIIESASGEDMPLVTGRKRFALPWLGGTTTPSKPKPKRTTAETANAAYYDRATCG